MSEYFLVFYFYFGADERYESRSKSKAELVLQWSSRIVRYDVKDTLNV